MTTVLISLVIAFIYVVINIITTKKIPESISSLVYNLDKTQQWIWIIWMWTISILLGPQLIQILPDNIEGLGFATMASLMFCGAMPLVKEDKNVLHNIFGVSAGILSQVCVAIINPLWLLVWIVILLLFVTSLVKSNKVLNKYGVFIAESLCAASTYGSLIS